VAEAGKFLQEILILGDIIFLEVIPVQDKF
jgi:hypothetical protein